MLLVSLHHHLCKHCIVYFTIRTIVSLCTNVQMARRWFEPEDLISSSPEQSNNDTFNTEWLAAGEEARSSLKTSADEAAQKRKQLASVCDSQSMRQLSMDLIPLYGNDHHETEIQQTSDDDEVPSPNIRAGHDDV